MYTAQKDKILRTGKRNDKNHLSKYMKLLNSFDSGHIQTRKKSSNEGNFNQSGMRRNLNCLSLPGKKISLSKINSIRNDSDMKSNKKMNKLHDRINFPQKSTDVQDTRQSSQLFLPSINLNNKRHSFIDSKDYARIKTLPINYPEQDSRIFFNKLQGSRIGNLIEYLKLKPTEKYFSKLQNVRLAQKLLLAQPSKHLRKSQLKKFYDQQKTYRSKISHSILIKNKWCRCDNSEWLN